MSDLISSILLLGTFGTGGDVPFWATANQYGIMPESNGVTMVAAASQPYCSSKDFTYHWGLSLAGRHDFCQPFEVIPDEVYAGIKWRWFTLDLGIRHGEKDFRASDPLLGSLSTTSGRICWSGNSRSMPGYTLSLEPFSLTGKSNIVQVFGTWGDYAMIDNRYSISNPLMHNLRMYLRFNVSRFSLTAGVDHFAMWAGETPDNGVMAHSFEDYCRMCLAMRASSTGTAGEQENVIGNQLGGMSIRLDWNPDWGKVSFLHDIPYEDRSGMRFENFPDGVNTLSLSFKDKDRWISDIVYEYIYSRNQSGPLHERPATPEEKAAQDPNDPWYGFIVLKGEDDYFNHEDYRSGWTAFGRTIGIPLFTPAGTMAGTWNRTAVTLGVENNRISAHHLGMSGKLFRKYPYRLMLTYSMNYGTCKKHRKDSEYYTDWPGYSQFSAGFNSIIPLRDGRFQLLPGIYLDRGAVLKDAFAVTLGLRYMIDFPRFKEAR